MAGTDARPARATPRWPWALLAAALVALPCLAVTFPPATDLPQHVAQMRLLEAARAGDPNLVVHWAAGNNLVYGVLAGLWSILPAKWVGPACLAIIGAAWALAGFWLAARRRRSVGSALLASALVFQQSLYWGFLNFLVGWPIFVLWLGLVLGPAPSSTAPPSTSPPTRARDLAVAALLSLALYSAHVLWFAAAGLFALAWGAFARPGSRRFLLTGATLVPGATAVALWFPSLVSGRAESGFDLAAHWFSMPWERLHPRWLADAAMGGLRDPIELVVLGAMLLWLASGLLLARRPGGDRVDRPLAIAAGLSFAIVLAAPDKYINTIYFAERFLPPAIALLLLAMPAPALRPRLTATLAALVLAALSIVTTTAWLRFQSEELAGLRAALDALPENPRVLGLDFVRRSELVRGRPFLQSFAWAQVERGGTLNFSFAEHGSCLVGYRRRPEIRWTPGLEWFAGRVRRSDLDHFDHVLVNGAAGEQARFSGFAARAGYVPLAGGARFVLYGKRTAPAPARNSASPMPNSAHPPDAAPTPAR